MKKTILITGASSGIGRAEYMKPRRAIWQDGYGAFTVNPSEVDTVTTYIQSKTSIIEKKTFQDEYRSFLKKYNVEIDERYVWD